MSESNSEKVNSKSKPDVTSNTTTLLTIIPGNAMNALTSSLKWMTEGFSFLMSDTIGQQILPLINDTPELHAIYVYCDSKALHNDWSKVKSAYMQNLCRSVEQSNRLGINLIKMTSR